jgi:hypothetical protein
MMRMLLSAISALSRKSSTVIHDQYQDEQQLRTFIYFIYLILATKQRRHPEEICAWKQRIQMKDVIPISSTLRRCAVRKSSGAGEPPKTSDMAKLLLIEKRSSMQVGCLVIYARSMSTPRVRLRDNRAFSKGLEYVQMYSRTNVAYIPLFHSLNFATAFHSTIFGWVLGGRSAKYPWTANDSFRHYGATSKRGGYL